jgi:hypothetical protein
MRRLADAPASERKRETEALWHTSNLLAWEQHSLLPLRQLRKLPMAEPTSVARTA